MHLVQSRIEVERDLGRLCHVKVDVVLEGKTRIVDIVVERVELLTAVAQHTRLMAQVEVHEVNDLMRTTANVHVGLLVERGILEDLLIPVHIRKHVRVDVVTGVGYLLVCVERAAVTLIVHSLVVELHELGTFDKFRLRGGHGDIALYTEANLRLLKVGTALRGDDKHAVGTTCTIHSCSGGIFQNREALDDIGIEMIKVILTDFHTIHDNKWIGCTTDRGNTADVEVGSIGTWLTAALCGNDTCQASGKGVGDVGTRHTQALRLYLLDRSNNRLFLLGGTEGGDHDIAQGLGILFHGN